MNAKTVCGAAVGWAWISVCAFGQQRVIQPSPAYYQSGSAPVDRAAPAQVQAPMAPPVYYAPPPVAQPVYAPQPKLTLAPAAADEEYEDASAAGGDEDGLYWFWGSKWPGLSLGPKIGTTGIGADLTFGVTRFLNLRSGFNFGTFTWDAELGGADYDMDIDMVSIPLLVDLYPAGGHFRISAGLYIQPDTKADIQSTPTEATQIGEHTYPPEVIGTLRGQVEVADAITPYLGIGFGNTVGEDQLLTFSLDIGVIFQSYDSSLTSDGAGMTTKLDTFRKDVELEAKNIQKDLDDFRIFPVLTLGLAWHF
ncbi:MAG: hypothetical protein EOM72_08455 [Opitutae bacterium]|nr:hypothetical protein [Opitutae bacterium]